MDGRNAGRAVDGLTIGNVPVMCFVLMQEEKTTTNFLCLGQNILVCDLSLLEAAYEAKYYSE